MSSKDDVKNEESYKELLGVRPKSEPRWNAIKGMSISIGILSGKLKNIKELIKISPCGIHKERWSKVSDEYSNEIALIAEKKEKLKREVKGS